MRPTPHTRSPGRRRLRLSAAALSTAALLTTLTAALPAGAAAGSPPAAGRGGCTPTWTVMKAFSGDGNAEEINVISTRDVWFTSTRLGLTAPVMLHWDGKSLANAPAQIPAAPQVETRGGGRSFDSPTHGWMDVDLNNPDVPLPNQMDTLAQWKNGRWTITPTADSPDATTSFPDLVDVESLATDDAWAVGRLAVGVGDLGGSGTAGALIERWNGRQWQIVDHPVANRTNAALVAVHAVSATDIWAVGHQRLNGFQGPLTMHYDGQRWSEVPAPPVERADLWHLSATDSDDVWAAGYQTTPDLSRTLPMIMHWDGAQWSQLPTPPDTQALSTGLSAAAPNDVWVGKGASDVAHWDGTAWTKVVPQQGQPQFGKLYRWVDVAVAGPDDVWAAGFSTGVGSKEQLIAHLSCGGR